MLMKNDHRHDRDNCGAGVPPATPAGEFILSPEELHLALTAIGDRADALLEQAAQTRDDNLLDRAWDHINLYNKICACTSVQPVRSTPRPRAQRRISRRASLRF